MARVIVVSGAGRGLGQALTEHFLKQGDVVAALSRSRTEFIAEASEKYGERIVFGALDVSDGAGVQGFVRDTVARHGGIDALVNNAGVAPEGLLAMAPTDDLTRVVETNLSGALRLTRACLRPMLAARRGRVVNVSSIAGLRGLPGLAAYSATKAALDGMTRALAREVGPRGITVNSVAPGFLDTAMSESLGEAQRRRIVRGTPLRRLGELADVVGVVDFLLSPAASFVTGQVVVVDGGYTV